MTSVILAFVRTAISNKGRKKYDNFGRTFGISETHRKNVTEQSEVLECVAKQTLEPFVLSERQALASAHNALHMIKVSESRNKIRVDAAHCTATKCYRKRKITQNDGIEMKLKIVRNRLIICSE